MNFSGVYQREKRNPSHMYHPMHNSIASYWTESLHKNEMKYDFADDYFLQNIHLIPDPLKKNLADTLFNTETPKKPEKVNPELKMTNQNNKVPSNTMSSEKPQELQGTTLGSMRGFFSGVMNVLSSVVFRSRSPVNYYDCFDVDSHQGSPPSWQRAKTDEQDKNGQAAERKTYDASPNPNVSTDMNSDRATVTSCESKLNQVLNLLSPKQTSSPVWVRKRPKKVFVEPGSVCDSFEDAFSPEDFVSLPNDSFIEYSSPVQYHWEEFNETAAPKTMVMSSPAKENVDYVKDVTNKNDLELKKDINDMQLEANNSKLETNNLQSENNESESERVNLQLEQSKVKLEKDSNMQEALDISTEIEIDNPTIKHQLVSSCEDKLTRLKALLQEKKQMKCKGRSNLVPETQTSPPKTIPIEKKSADKHYKNPRRQCNKRSKSKLKCRIEDDLVFANEVNLSTPPSVENSPRSNNYTSANFGDYFDEVSGRFRTSSLGSDDSFQIVFNDCSKLARVRTTSDCDSEDSFIVFEDSPDFCYTSTDVFGDSESESEISDSGCGMGTCKLAHMLTRTVSNLADDSLYVESEDEVDFANVDTVSDVVEEQKSGLLLDDAKKLRRKCQPAKKVHFTNEPPKVHVMRVWAFAARQARAGHWERYAVDRERFKRRIADVDVAVSWVLKPQHRSRVMFQRFMPWWNQLKRKELAEKKEMEAQQKYLEEQRLKELEEQGQDEKNNEGRSETETGDDSTTKDDLNIENELSSDKDLKSKNDNSDCKDVEKITKSNDSQLLNLSDSIGKEDSRVIANAEDDDKLLQYNNSKLNRNEGFNSKVADSESKEGDRSDKNNDSKVSYDVANDNIQKEESRTFLNAEDDSKLLEYNNNKVLNCKTDNGKISTDIINQNVKKVQEVNDTADSNFEKISS